MFCYFRLLSLYITAYYVRVISTYIFLGIKLLDLDDELARSESYNIETYTYILINHN